MRSTDATARPSRHDRVWLHPSSWRAALRVDVAAEPLALVEAWVRRGRPLVARRRDAAAPPEHRYLGVTFPLAHGRHRVGLVVDGAAVVRCEPPLRLDEVIDAAPFRCRGALSDLQHRAVGLDTVLHVYGSFAWQKISGEACVTAGSDIDLLWEARDARQIDRVIAMLLEWEGTSGLRADGEVRMENGDAIAWRELTMPAARVMVKRDDGIALRASPLIGG